GKEYEDGLNESIATYDFGARNYDPALGRWMNIDPLAEKYYSISPYTYVANNPLYFKDPDGERIWIYYQDSNGDDRRVEYKNGQLYSEDGKVHKPQNDFLFSAMEALDNLGSTKIGQSVLNDLVNSDDNFDLKGTTTSEESTAGFNANKDKEGNYTGGGTLLLGADQSLETVSHELFHAYQYEKNGDGYSINDEIGAYLFGQAVNEEYYTSQGGGFFPSGAGFGTNSAAGETYEQAYDNLYYSKNFDLKSYESAIQNFKKGAQKNLSGIYNKFPIKPINQNKILISKFYPLVKD
ncbi:RHS repeat-associated core domain-containing protein, partial [Flagellimonas taeanensis]